MAQSQGLMPPSLHGLLGIEPEVWSQAATSIGNIGNSKLVTKSRTRTGRIVAIKTIRLDTPGSPKWHSA